MSKHKLYLAVTPDRFELPIAVSDTAVGLAKMVGTSTNSVLSVISHSKRHKRSCMYHKITYTEREWRE